MATDKRPPLSDILGGDSHEFNELWDSTEAAEEFKPLPGGKYRCLVADGKRAESRTNKTPSYKVTFEVLDGEFKGRRVSYDFWLTKAALPTTKRDLAKLGIERPEQLKHPPPAGLIAEVKVVVNTENDDQQFNKVTGFKVVDKAPASDALEPDASELGYDIPEEPRGGDGLAVAEGNSPNRGTEDDQGFDWAKGEQNEPPAHREDPEPRPSRTGEERT
jgi:hypothetical protein